MSAANRLFAKLGRQDVILVSAALTRPKAAGF
jgi:hypothetical protein